MWPIRVVLNLIPVTKRTGKGGACEESPRFRPEGAGFFQREPFWTARVVRTA